MITVSHGIEGLMIAALSIPSPYYFYNLSNYLNCYPQGMIHKLESRTKSSNMLASIAESMINGIVAASGEHFVRRGRVGDLLFDGHKVEMFDKIISTLSNFGVHLPPFMPNNTFGIMYGVSGLIAI